MMAFLVRVSKVT